MAFNSNIPGHILIGDDDIIFGTCMLGTEFGEITKADLERGGNEQEIPNNRGGMRAVILANPHWVLSLETTFDATVDPPEMGEEITFPYAGVKGRVMPGAKIAWEQNGSRKLSFSAKHWDAMSDGEATPGNAAFSVDASGVATPL